MDFDALAKHIENVQKVLQGQAAHAINLAVTSRNWLTGYYIVEYEQHGEDRAKYGEALLPKLEKRLKIKGLTARNMQKHRRLYRVYPDMGYPILNYLNSNPEIRSTVLTEFKLPIRSTVLTELAANDGLLVKQSSEQLKNDINRLFSKIPASHLLLISAIEEPLKRFFYEVETIRGCWSYRELDRQISSFYYERSGLSGNKERRLLPH